jgi:tetratricopeptide (TPR) repeat protein
MSRLILNRFAAILVAANVFVLGVYVAAAWAANEGQADLDKATTAKLDAETTGDLAEVIHLTESALEKGLDEGNTKFAKQILASTLIQRGSVTVSNLFKDGTRKANWKQQRQSALDDLEKAVAIDPQQSQAWLLIAQLNLIPGGTMEKAREAIEKSLAIPEDADDPTVRAKVLVLRASFQDDLEKKLADLDEALRLVPGDAAIIRARGLLLGDMEKLEASLENLNKAIELEPEDASTYEAKAMVLARLKRFDEALATLDKAMELSPKTAILFMQKAQVYLQQGKMDAAMEAMNQAQSLEPDNIDVLLLRAAILHEQGKKEESLTDIKHAIELHPENPKTLRTLAVFLLEQKQFAEAEKIFEKLHEANPKDTLTLMQMSILFAIQKKYDKAAETYTTLLAEDPDQWEALRGRGDCYLNVGKQAEAIADYEKALKLEPKDPGVLNNLAWVLATSTDEKLRDGKRALELATKACELTEYKVSHILSTLAAAYGEIGDFETAKKWSAKSIEVDDEDHGEALKKELESYQAGKPWREVLPDDDEPAAESKQPADASAKEKTPAKP